MIEWGGTDEHIIIDETGKELTELTYTLICTCKCSHVFTAVSSTKRKARKIIRGKYRKHLEEISGN